MSKIWAAPSEKAGKNTMKRKTKRGFTLTEIMIVVAIVGLLATMAMPAYVRARENSQEAVCLNNLRILMTAKSQHAVDARKQNGEEVVGTDLDPYLKAPFSEMDEPAGTDYEILPVGELPLCLFGGSHTLL